MKKEFPSERNWKVKAREVLEGEVKTYSQYLEGDVYYFDVGFDSCGGFYGYNDALAEAKSSIDFHVQQTIKKHLEYLKQQIKNHVGISYRKPLEV